MEIVVGIHNVALSDNLANIKFGELRNFIFAEY